MKRDAIENKNIFITGGTGFIGSWLIERLIQKNRIWCYDNGRCCSLKMEQLRRHKNLMIIDEDILDNEKLKRSIPKKIDVVIHAAAIAGVWSYYKIPLETMKVNLIGTYNLLEVVKDRRVEIFIDFSTSEVYGAFAENAGEEDDTQQGPISDMRWTYSISKLASEKLCHCYRHKYNLPVVSLRPFNIYGPYQVGEGAIHIFADRAIRDDDIWIYGDGSQTRAWCYIDDLMEGVLACIRNKRGVVGNVFNLGNPRAAVNMIELADHIIKIAGSKSKIRFKKNVRTDIQYRVPNISKARRLLNFSPKVGLREGLRRTIEWYRENPR